jgi:ABC-type sulfate/molybdate transport systems ATPase subunit
MAVQPRLLLLDEPFTALDLVLKDLLLDQIAQLSARLDTRIVLVSHFPPDAVALNGLLAVLEDGVVREQGQYDELLQQPKSRTLAAWQRRFRVQARG